VLTAGVEPSAGSTCRSENARKSHMFEALLEVELSKKGTRLWCEARLEVKMLRTLEVRAAFAITARKPATQPGSQAAARQAGRQTDR